MRAGYAMIEKATMIAPTLFVAPEVPHAITFK